LYTVLVIGTFAVVGLVANKGDQSTELGDFKGLGHQRPALALALTVFLLAQAGVPLTSGFIAKFGVIQSAVAVQSYAIAIIAMLTSVVGAFLYLRIMVSVWLLDSKDAPVAPRIPVLTGITVGVAAAFTLFVGIIPGWLLDATHRVMFLAGR